MLLFALEFLNLKLNIPKLIEFKIYEWTYKTTNN